MRQLTVFALLAVAGCASSPPPPARALLGDLRARRARVEAATNDMYQDPDADRLDVQELVGLTRDEIGEGLGVRFVGFSGAGYTSVGTWQPDGTDQQVGFYRLPPGSCGGGVTLLLRFDGLSGSSRCIQARWGHTK